MDLTSGTVVARRFRLVRELGRGSMGTVWLADHSTLGLRCAVKFASAEAEREPFFRERFEREARAVARLDCPNVVRVLDYDTFEGVPFLAMEWLSGEDLETRLRRERRLEPSEVHRIVSQVAQGLERAHAAGIVHRDLKPGNVFIANTDDGEVAKILDFGLAKVASGDATAMTQAGSVLGTPVYMSPEQARSVSEVDERSDLWSLAVITYECLLGKLPFDGPSLGEVFARIMFEPIPVPSDVDPTVPVAFDRWWKRAASRDVDGRFGSALEMADALHEALGLDDVRSPHTPLPALATAHTVPPPRRRPSRRWAAAVVFATLGIAGASFMPDAPHVVVPQGLLYGVDDAMRAVVESASRLTAQASAALPSFSPTPASSLGSALVEPPSEAPHTATVLTAEVPRVIPPPTPAAITTPSAIAPVASVAAAHPHQVAAPVDDTSETAVAAVPDTTECRSGQLRCDGRVLQMCNEAHDGWADVTECASGTLCDATGSGGCAAPQNERPSPSPSDESTP
jgi:serine/threonine protein kinase